MAVYYSHHPNHTTELPEETRIQIRDVCDALVAHIYAPKLGANSTAVLSALEQRTLQAEADCLMQTFYYLEGRTQPKDMLGYV